MIMQLAKTAFGLGCLLALSACGGGGSSAPAQDPNRVVLEITPSSPSLTVYEGETQHFSLSAKSAKNIEKAFNVALVDSVGLVSTDVKFVPVSQLEYRADLQTSTVLSVGVHTSTLELRLCEDDPQVCKQPLPGSPWKIPLTVTVKSGSNLSALSVLPQVPNWSTYQGNAAHTGHVAASFDINNFTRRWQLPASNQSGEMSAVTHDGGKVFLVSSQSGNSNALLRAISEDSGQELWHVDLGPLHHVNPPAAANGKVFVTSTGHGDTYYWVFSQASGELLSKQSMASQWENYLAPTIYDGAVYSDSGYYGGMIKFDAASHTRLWASTALPQYDGWTPAVDASYAYVYMSGSVYALRAGDGGTAFSIVDPDNSWSGYTGATVVLSDKNTVFVTNGGRLMAFDLAGRNRAWSANGSARGQPAYAHEVVYVLNANGTVLEAHAGATGALLWTSNSLSGSFSRLVLSDNLAFLSSDESTVAIDLATHKTVWQYPLGGELSISNRGVLYIGSAGGKLSAVNLR